MAYSINHVFLVGRLGKDADTTLTTNGTPVSKFSLATERSWKDKATDEWKKETDWHNVVLWRNEKLAALLVKGVLAVVEGRLQTRKYEDRSGETRYVTEVVAESVVVAGQRDGRSTASSGKTAKGSEADPFGVDDDDIPF